jgi:hypothetical protein
MEIAMSTLRPDRPIRQSRADLLGRGRLVSAIVEQILGIPSDGKAITIGLNAQWGAGKSSFLNLLQERLRTVPVRATPEGEDDLNPIVLRFNPWLFGSIEQLIRMFFADLARAVDQRDSDADLGALLEVFGNLVAAASTVFPTGASELANLLGREVRRIGRQAQRPPSLNEQKTAIDRALAKIPRRIVVFIDDVDRLEPELTTLFFRMVRLNANFNNVVYVLAFDRAVVEGHLAHDSPAFGREYLEKIIQVSYNIPPPHPRIIPCLLKDEMVAVRRAIERTVFVNVRYERLFDARRYDLVFTKDFAQHFTTVRSIKRYVNALRLTLPPVAGQVDLVDFYVIELVRLLYPDVYLQIAQHKEMLVDRGRDDRAARRRGEWLAWVRESSSVPGHLCDSVQGLLCILFPVLDESEPDAGSEEATRLRWARDKRVCSPDAFDRFFSLAGERSEASEMRGSVSQWVANDGAIRNLFEHARKTGQIRKVLRELGNPDLTPKLTADQAMRVATIICASDTRDDLQLADAEDSYVLVGDVVKQCMKRYGQGNEFRFWRTLIDGDGSVFTVSKVFEEIPKLQGILGNNAQRLQRDLGDRILADVQSEGFWDGNRWYYLLSVVRRLGRDGDVLKEVEDRMVDRGEEGESWYDDRLLRFCETFLEAVVADKVRGGPDQREEGIDGWIPANARARLQTLVDNGGEDAVRARTLVNDLWGS